MTAPTDGGWVRIHPGQPQDPAIRLFCFPYAGAGASIYRHWQLPWQSGVQLCAAQPPGRENRMGVPPLRRIEQLVDACARELAPLLDRPFAFFGHSMGALVAFELTRALRRRGGPAPVHLFVSAHRAPELPAKRGPVSQLGAQEFRDRLLEMAGPSVSVLRDPDLMAALAPMMRADFEACETYRYRAEAPLDVPITGFAADDDVEVDPEDVAGWDQHTTVGYRLLRFIGGHLFLRDRAQDVLAEIGRELAAVRTGRTRG